jgi:hypothetical protein
LVQDRWREIQKGPQRLVLCRLMIDLMRTVHGAYAPVSESFGTRLETFFIGLFLLTPRPEATRVGDHW